MTAKTASGKPVFMLAIDSMSLPFAQGHLDRLPVLKGLLESGQLIPLKSGAKYASASVWATFNSGTDPGAHGHYFPMQWDADTHSYRRITKSRWSKKFSFDPFWFEFAQKDVPCIVLDPVHVIHEKRAPCLQIVGWNNQVEPVAMTSDPSVLKEIRAKFGRRPIGHEVPIPKDGRQCRRISEQLMRSVKAKADAILWLMEKRDWQFFLSALYEVHMAGHNLWPVEAAFASDAEADAMLSVYEENDRQLGRILQSPKLRDAYTVIFSLHGMTANFSQDHFLAPILSRLNDVYMRGAKIAGAEQDGSNLFSMLRQTVPAGLQYKIVQTLGADVQDWVVSRSYTGGKTWSETPSFHVPTGGEGLVRFNIKGRERHGFFEAGGDELAKYQSWLSEELLKIKVTATGQPLIEQICSMASLFPGPRAHLLPDLAVLWAPDKPAESVSSETIGTINSALGTGRGGNHTDDCFALILGGDGTEDLAKTVSHIKDLHLLPRRALGLMPQ